MKIKFLYGKELQKMNYRPEIDGLRAVAVISVILFHYDFSLISGGYVGVDIFFVISGYLITTILANEMQDGAFTFRKFYARRARRILPALIMVTFFCILFSWLWMTPSQFKVFSGSIFSNNLFLSNFYFLSQVEYFQPDANLQPLIHTWSLSIEEQYYLLFPVFLTSIWKFGKRLTFTIIFLFVFLGIYLAHVGTTDDAAKNYFHSGGRFWEIGIGSLTALLVLNKSRPINNFSAAFGLILIVWAILSFDKLTPFPSLYTLAPVIGTMLLLISATSSKGIGKALSNKYIITIGKISYSAYLLHQPILAYSHLRTIGQLQIEIKIMLIFITFFLSYISWKFIENPFRNGKHLHITKAPYFSTFLVSSTTFLTSFGLIGYLFGGFPQRTFNNINLAALDARLKVNPGLDITCTSGETRVGMCQTAPQVDFYLWGDSYGMHLVPGLIAANPDIKLAQRTLSGCAPVIGFAFLGPKSNFTNASDCFAFNQNVIEQLSSSSPMHILLSSEFALNEKNLWDQNGNLVPRVEAVNVFSNSLIETIQVLETIGHKVTVISPPPEPGWDVGECLSKMLRFDFAKDSCNFNATSIVNNEIFSIFENIPINTSVVRLDNAICRDGQCNAFQNGVFIYRDKGHLSIEGSNYLGSEARIFDKIFQN